MTSPEPRFARIAAIIGDPTRARMLSALMGGQYMAAGELAAASGVSAQTATGHLTKLIDSELVMLRTQGRHRYFKLASAEIGHALEALSLVAESSASAAKWNQGAYKPLKFARTCYSHLAGELGVALFEGLIARGTVARADIGERGGELRLTDIGRIELECIGVVLPKASSSASTRFAYACVDWSERRDHLAGGLAVALLDHAIEAGWLRRTEGSRALKLTPTGSKALAPWLDAQTRERRAMSHNPTAHERLAAQEASQPS